MNLKTRKISDQNIQSICPDTNEIITEGQFVVVAFEEEHPIGVIEYDRQPRLFGSESEADLFIQERTSTRIDTRELLPVSLLNRV